MTFCKPRLCLEVLGRSGPLGAKMKSVRCRIRGASASHTIVLPSDLRSLMDRIPCLALIYLRTEFLSPLVFCRAFVHMVFSENDSVPRMLLAVGTQTLHFRHHGACTAAQVPSLLLTAPTSMARHPLSRRQCG